MKMDSLKTESLSQQAFRFIEEGILSERFPPGYVLNEVAIAKELSISRTPVREAIKQLEVDGLVRLVLNKGAVVVGLTDEDINNMRIIRAFLEGLCARWAAESLTEEELDKLSEVIELQRFYHERGNAERAWISGRDFHTIIFHKSRSRQALNLLATYLNYFTLHMRRLVKNSSKQYVVRTIAEHQGILDALKKRDGILAEQLMNDHLKKEYLRDL